MNLTLHTSFAELDEAEWNALLSESITHVPFLRCEYQRAWWNTRGGGEWPENASLALVAARRDGRLVGVAPLFHAPDHQGRPALMLVGSVEISDYLDLIARPEDLEAFVEALLPFLRQAGLPDWQALDLYNLLDSSPTRAVLEKTAGKLGWGCQTEKLQHSPYIPLPGDWDQYLAGIDKKQRHEIRRKMRRAGDGMYRVDWYIVEDADRLEEESAAFIEMMAQDPAKQAFLTPAMSEAMQEIMRCAFEAGWLHLAFLTFDDMRAAGYLSFRYLNRLWVYNSGMDTRFSAYSPGWVLLGLLLQWANENGLKEFDFLRGDEEYKYRFGAVDRSVMRVTLRPDGE